MAKEQIDLNKKLLERGYWIATHRMTLERWSTRGLYALIVLVYMLFFVQFGVYVYRLDQWSQLIYESIQPSIDWRTVHEQQAPLEIEFGSPALFTSSDRKYDFVVEVYNPNQQWAVESLDYVFTYGDTQATESKTTFVLPGERRYITVLGLRSETPIQSVGGFTTSNYHWRKVSRLPPLSWDFIEAPTYVSKRTIVENRIQRVLPAEVNWKVRNASTLNIRTVVWQIAYISGSKLVGVAEHLREDFPFLEERTFSFSVPDTIGRVDRVKVYPIVDIFDPGFSYLPQS